TGRTTTSIALSWNASTDPGALASGVAGYDVFRDGANVASPSGTAFNDAGLGLGTTHSYAVRARDKAGNASALSSAVTATTKTAECSQVPPVPSGLTSPGQARRSVDLAWTASNAGGNCTVKYNVFRDGTLVTQVATNSAKILNLVSSTTYRFTVAAVDEVGSSAQSAALSVTTLA